MTNWAFNWLTFPSDYDADDSYYVQIPRSITPLLAGTLIAQWEKREPWDTANDYEQGRQVAYLLQERLLTPVETITLKEQISTPATPSAGAATLFLRDDGSGQQQLCIVYDDGSVNVLDTQL